VGDGPGVGPDVPKPVRHDFGLKVELLGGRAGPDGLHLLTAAEPIRFRLETERDAYVGIWTVGPDGSVTQLFPNEHERDHRVLAGRPRLVPGNDRYVIDPLATPAGKAEALRVVAATRRWEPPEGEKLGPFALFRSADDRQRLQRHLRTLLVRPKADAPAEEAAVTEEALLYRVLAR
jgi:hypothetical protein